MIVIVSQVIRQCLQRLNSSGDLASYVPTQRNKALLLSGFPLFFDPRQLDRRGFLSFSWSERREESGKDGSNKSCLGFADGCCLLPGMEDSASN
jgi:hypothetical protein